MMRYMVSWWKYDGTQGNTTFDSREETSVWLEANRNTLRSWSRFQYTPDPSGVSTLHLI